VVLEFPAGGRGGGVGVVGGLVLPSGAVGSVEFPTVGAAASVTDALGHLVGVDPHGVGVDERLGVLDALESAERLLAGLSMRWLVAVDDRADLDCRFGMSPGGYSEQRYGKRRLSWVSTIRRGRALMAHLPLVFDALCDGRISRERAELFAAVVNPRNSEVLAAAQAELLDLSDAEPRFREFSQQLRALAVIADPDGREPDAPVSSARVSRSGNHLAVVMDVYGDNAIALEQLISVAVDALRRRWQADVDACPDLMMPSAPQLREQAITELVLRGAGADSNCSRPTVARLSLLVDADRVDDLDPMLAAVLSGIGLDGFAASGPGGMSLRFTNPFRSGHHGDRSAGLGADDRPGASGPGGSGGSGGPNGSGDGSCGGCGEHHQMPTRLQGQRVLVSTPDGDRVELSAQQWQLLLCDADISEVLLDKLGEPVAVRDRVRLAGSKMRVGLIGRDGGCVFPGCDAPAGWCDAHHVVEYAKGGRTIIVNLALLCRRHHGIVHRAGWRMERNPDPGASGRARTGDSGGPGGRGGGFFTITTAGGHQMTTQHRSRPPRPDDPPGEPPQREPVPA